MVRGKPSSRLDRGVDIPPTLSVGIGFILCCATLRLLGQGSALEPCSRGEWHYPQAGKKGKRLFGNDPTVFQTCVLGLPSQVKKFDSNHLLLTVWNCLIPLPHRVIRATILFINLDVCLLFYHDWIVVAYIEWLIN